MLTLRSFKLKLITSIPLVFLFSFSSARCDRIEAVRWLRGTARDAGAQLERMNRREVDYFHQYSKLLTNFIESSGIDVTAVRC